jgi:ABC-type oligopeptide transport system ATPase subunit
MNFLGRHPHQPSGEQRQRIVVDACYDFQTEHGRIDRQKQNQYMALDFYVVFAVTITGHKFSHPL